MDDVVWIRLLAFRRLTAVAEGLVARRDDCADTLLLSDFGEFLPSAVFRMSIGAWPARSTGRLGPECGYVAQLTKLRLVLEASKYTIEHLSGLGTANDEADDNPFSRAGADNVNYKSGRTDDDIMELLEATCLHDWTSVEMV